MRPHEAGVWELKTPDLRLFGWFHRRDCFLIGSIMDAVRAKTHDLYAGLRDEARRRLLALDLEPPIHVGSDAYDDVLSNAPRR